MVAEKGWEKLSMGKLLGGKRARSGGDGRKNGRKKQEAYCSLRRAKKVNTAWPRGRG